MTKKQNKFCDLHIHSSFSDSDATIETIYLKAKEKGLCCISVTDHDTLDAAGGARLLSARYGIEYIEGIELSAQKDNSEVHVLGYFVDVKNRALQEAIAQMRKLRMERIAAMAEKLNALGLKVDKDEILKETCGCVPTRLHLGAHLVKKGIVKSYNEAFDKYLGVGRPAYVSRFKFSVGEAVSLIRAASGLSFLAHPHLLTNQAWVEEIARAGIDGLEVNYLLLPDAKKYMYDDIIKRYGLLKSGGSDAHGSFKKHTDIGKINVPYEWVQAMKDRLARNADDR
jgi:predicted metal-dependent phosphoesterase TrpH